MKKKSLLLWMLLLLTGGVSAQRILFIGDSITDGGWGRSCGSSTPSAARNAWDLNHLYGHSYMMLCAAHYEAIEPETAYTFFNRGISGDDLARIEARWEEDVLALQPDVVSLLAGTNDILYHLQEHADETFDGAAWEARYRSLLDRVRQANPEVKLILGTPFVAQVGKIGASDVWPQHQALIQGLAERVVRIAADYGAAVVRYDQLFAEQTALHPTVPASHWIWDGIHPTAAGHRIMADRWIEVYDQIRYIQ